ncbi:MAG: chitosanase, partial [Desulfovibrionaceae bacterium]|nr:chitosanase [Desulfovibrionaceae bacterium]
LEEWLQLLENKGGESAEIAKRLRAAGPTNTGSKSGAFVDAYLKEASANTELFESTQRESLLKHNYNPAMARLQSDSLRQMIQSDKSLQEMMFSTAVQHGGGGAAKIFNGVYREGMSREDLIRAVYAKRGGQFGSSTAQVQQSVLNRMDRERDLILGMNRGEANIRSLREGMTKGGNEAVQAGVSSMVAEATQDAMNRGVKYNMGGKNSA